VSPKSQKIESAPVPVYAAPTMSASKQNVYGESENPPVGGVPPHITLLSVIVVVQPETVVTERVTSYSIIYCSRIWKG
jgi:hypothetical protein